MTIKYTYVCDKCGKEFMDEEGAVLCEAGHYGIAKAAPSYASGAAIPKSIEVTFSNEGKRIYILG